MYHVYQLLDQTVQKFPRLSLVKLYQQKTGKYFNIPSPLSLDKKANNMPFKVEKNKEIELEMPNCCNEIPITSSSLCEGLQVYELLQLTDQNLCYHSTLPVELSRRVR